MKWHDIFHIIVWIFILYTWYDILKIRYKKKKNNLAREIEAETKRCAEDPYYFYRKYFRIEGKSPEYRKVDKELFEKFEKIKKKDEKRRRKRAMKEANERQPETDEARMLYDSRAQLFGGSDLTSWEHSEINRLEEEMRKENESKLPPTNYIDFEEQK